MPSFQWNDLTSLDIDLSLFRPVYAPKDFLDILAQVQSPNMVVNNGTGGSATNPSVNGGGGSNNSLASSGKDGKKVEHFCGGTSGFARPSGMITVPLNVATLSHLREKFSELARAEPHLGLDPGAPSLEDPASTLELERFNLGRKVLAANHAPLSQEFLKKGAPHSLRGKLWSQVLGCGSGGEEGMVGSGGGAGPSGITAKESEYYQSLQVMDLLSSKFA